MGMAVATWQTQGAEAAALRHHEDKTNPEKGPFDTNMDEIREKNTFKTIADDQTKLALNHEEQKIKRLAEEEEQRQQSLRTPLITKIRKATKKILQKGGSRAKTTQVVTEIYAEHKAPQPNNQKETQNKQLKTELNDQYLQLATAIALEQADINAANTSNQADIASATDLTQADNTAATEKQIDKNKAAALNAEANQEQQQARLEKGHELIIAIIITESLLSSKDHSKKDINETVDRIEQLRSEQHRHRPLKEIVNKEGILTHGMKEKVNKAMDKIKGLEKGSEPSASPEPSGPAAQEWRGENAKNNAKQAATNAGGDAAAPHKILSALEKSPAPTPFKQ